jgi:hypothetical protein
VASRNGRVCSRFSMNNVSMLCFVIHNLSHISLLNVPRWNCYTLQKSLTRSSQTAVGSWIGAGFAKSAMKGQLWSKNKSYRHEIE